MVAYLRLLGAPAIQVQDGWLEPPSGKSSALLFHLAYQQQWVNRADLVYLFWPDTSEEKARRNLRQLLSKIRRLTFAGDLSTEDTRLRWAVRTDVQGFKEAISERRWPQAVQLYEGELLQGFGLPDAPEFESWLALEREEVWAAWQGAVLNFAEELEGTARHTEAAELLGKLFKADPLDEAALRRYLSALYRSGERHGALKTYERFRRTLQEELDAEPEEDTLRLVATIERAEPLSTDTGVKVEARSVSTMPTQATPFIGREGEIAKLAEQLENSACRLLSIVSPGGMGKTRLAIEVASRQKGFRDGVHFVPFAAVNSPGFMISAIAGALNFTFFGSDDPKLQLLDYLRNKEKLLVLDNLEHLLAGMDLLVELLASAPGIKLLATSRERLALHAEWVYDLEGMRVPEASDANLQDADAVQLFVQTAKKTRADFTLNDNAETVAHICRLVGGMPLALELAASWLRVLNADEIAAELARGLDLLESSLRDLPERHHTIRAVFDVSWQRLSKKEQAALRKLSVFHGGFTKVAAAEVAEVSLPLLLALSNKSFVCREASGRFAQHPLMWQYLREKASAEVEASDHMQARHAAYFAAFLHERKDLLQGLEAAAVRKDIGEELANIREAWFWTVVHQREDLIDQASESFYIFCNEEGLYHEAETLFSLAAREMKSRSVVHGRVLCLLGGCYNYLTTYQQGIRVLQQSLAMFEAHGAKREEALACLLLGSCYGFANRPLEEVATNWRRCAHLFRNVGDLAHEGEVLGLLAEYVKDPTEANRQFREALQLFRASGKSFGMLGGITLTLSNFAMFVAHVQGAYQQAIRLTEEAIRIEQARGESYRMVWYLNSQAEYFAYQGDYPQAETLLSKAQTIGEALESGWGKLELDRALCGLGQLAHLRGEPEKAKRYLTHVLEQTKLHGDAFGTWARAMDTLGRIALDEGNPSEAEEQCQEAMRFFSSLNPQRSGRDWAKAWCLLNLTDIALAKEDSQAAQTHLQDALSITKAWQLKPIALRLLVSFARLLQHHGDEQSAMSLLELAASHPAGMFETKEAAARSLASLAPGEYTARKQRDATELQGLVQALVTDLLLSHPDE